VSCDGHVVVMSSDGHVVVMSCDGHVMSCAFLVLLCHVRLLCLVHLLCLVSCSHEQIRKVFQDAQGWRAPRCSQGQDGLFLSVLMYTYMHIYVSIRAYSYVCVSSLVISVSLADTKAQRH